MKSSASADLDLMRAAQLLEADPAAAAALARGILAGHPDHEAAGMLLANALRLQGDVQAGLQAIESLGVQRPDSAVMQLEMARGYAAAGKSDAAGTALRRAVELDPQLADAWRELAANHFAAGEILAGDRAYLSFSRLTRDPPELTDALVALTENRLETAAALVEPAPRSPAVLRLRARLAERRGAPFEAERHLRDCLQLAPGDCAAREQLARLLLGQERLSEAQPLIERLRAVDPDSRAYTVMQAQSLRLLGRTAQALPLLQEQVARAPDADVWIMIGDLKRELGNQSGAVDAYRSALIARPGYGQAYWALANLKTWQPDEHDLGVMQDYSARSRPTGESGDPAIALEFACGAALESRGRYPQAFLHYERGNQWQRASIEYDPEVTTAYTRRAQALFTREFFAARAGWGHSSADPIFIVGLPRSGSTLLEQILASHPQVEGTRELFEVPLMAQQLDAGAGPEDAAGYPERLAMLSRSEVDSLAQRYLERTLVHRPRRSNHFVDKMLANFAHVGLIHLMFPRSVIIDARRHPLACAFSCYKQRFSRGMNFSYEQREMARYYRDYADLMAHMDQVLPGRMYRLYYERLVADPDGEVRRLLEHCRLPWDEACLRFHENPRVVQTISSEQVRQPLYASGVDQWRHFEPWLAPLREELAELVEQYPVR